MTRTLDEYRAQLKGIDLPDDILSEAVKGIGGDLKVVSPDKPNVGPANVDQSKLTAVRKTLGGIDLPDDILAEAAGFTPPVKETPAIEPTLKDKVAAGANKIFKTIPEHIQNAGLKAILNLNKPRADGTVPQLGDPDYGMEEVKPLLLAGAVQLNGIYKGLTGIDIPISEETTNAIKSNGISPTVAHASGEIVGGLGIFLGMGKVLQAGKAGAAVAESFARTPELARLLGAGTTAGIEFGGSGGFKEAIKQITSGKLSATDFGKLVLKDTAVGAGFGVVTAGLAGQMEDAIPDALLQTAGASAYGFGVSALEGHDLLSSTISGATAGLYALAGAKDATEAQKMGAFSTAKLNVETAAKMEAAKRGYTDEQAGTFGSIAVEKFTNFVNRIEGEKVSIQNWDKISKDIYKEMGDVFDKGDPIARVPKDILLDVMKKQSSGEPVTPPAATPPKKGEGLKLVDVPEQDVTTIDGTLFGGPQGVQSFQQDLPLLAQSILGKEFPASVDVVKDGLKTALTARNQVLQQGGHPDDAQLAAMNGFLSVVSPNKASQQPTDNKAIEKPPQTASGQEVQSAAASLGVEPHELTYDQFKRAYAEDIKGMPEENVRADYKQTILSAIKAGKDVPESIIQGLQALVHAGSPDLNPLPEAPATPTGKKVRRDSRGIPILKPKAVVLSIDLGNGQTATITHAEALKHAQGMMTEALDAWQEHKAHDLLKKVGKIRWTDDLANLGDLSGKIVPGYIRAAIFTKDSTAPTLDEKADELGMTEAELIKQIVDYPKTAKRAPSKKLSTYYDQAIHEFEHFAMNPEALMEKRAGYTAKQPAYHGSPYRFDKFSLQKIGSGEGNQTFGWGLYFSGKKDVAEYYRRMLTPDLEIPASVRLALSRDLGILSPEMGNHTAEQAIEKISQNPGWKGYYSVNLNDPVEAKAAAIVDEFLKQVKSPGHVYEVDIPEDGEYLNFDKPLSEQSPQVKSIWENDLYRHFISSSHQLTSKSTGAALYDALQQDFGDDPERASRYLLSKGIPGLRYLDQGSRITGEGTYNYVLFDDSKIKINSVSESKQMDVSDVMNGTPIGKVRSATEFKRKEVDVAFKTPPKVPGESDFFSPPVGPRQIYDSAFAVKYQKTGNLFIPNQKVYSPHDIAFAFRFLHNEAVENFLIGAVKGGKIVGIEHIATGRIDQVSVDFFDILHLLDHVEADGYFLVHNHPSGRPEPSPEDVTLTKSAIKVMDRSGYKFMGHVVIDDTTFGFIDGELKVRQWAHKEYEQTKQIPMLRKYLEWTQSKTSGVIANSPRTVFEIAKGIQQGNDEGMVFFMNTQNRILNAVVIPHSQMNAGDLQKIAARYRGNSIIISNSGVPARDLSKLKSDLLSAGVRLLDEVSVSKDGYKSAVESNAMEGPAEYKPDLELSDQPGIYTAKEKLDDEYNKARAVEGKMPEETTKEFMVERRKTIGDFFKYIGEVSSQSLFKIGPELMYATRRFESNYRQQIKKDMTRAMPFIHGLTALRKSNAVDHLIMDLAMKNGDMAMQTQIAQKHGFLPDLEAVRTLLEEIRPRIKAAGYEVGYRTGYFPRVIKNGKKFREYLEKQKGVGGEIEQAIREKEAELGRQLNDEEAANLINSFIRGFVRSKIALAKTGNMKLREIEKVTVDLNRFYYSGREGLIRYIEQVNEAIEARKFFGKAEVKPELDPAAEQALSEMSEEEKKQSALSWNNINDSIGAFVNRLLDQGKISPGQQLELKKIYLSRFGYIGTHGIFGLYKNLEYLSSITNPISGLSQLDDLAASLYLSAWHTPGSFIRALMNKSNITLHDLGLEAMAEEVREASHSSSALRWLLHKSGFTYFDAVMKECHTNAVMDKIIETAKGGGDAALDEKLTLMFGSEADQVMEDLKAGRKTENVLFLAFNELSEYQPVTLLETPRFYQDAPGGRIMYQFKTFFLKRLDFLLNAARTAPDKKTAIKRFLHLYALMLICGAGVDVAKDMILGRKLSLTDLVIDNLIKPFGISKFLLYRIRDYGPGEILANFLLPSHKLIDSIWRDVKTEYRGDTVKTGPHTKEPKMLEIPASIPIGGKLWYWWFGRGAQKQREKQFKQDNKARKNRL